MVKACRASLPYSVRKYTKCHSLVHAVMFRLCDAKRMLMRAKIKERPLTICVLGNTTDRTPFSVCPEIYSSPMQYSAYVITRLVDQCQIMVRVLICCLLQYNLCMEEMMIYSGFFWYALQDIHSGNVLIFYVNGARGRKTIVCKLSDFGLSRKLQRNQTAVYSVVDGLQVCQKFCIGPFCNYLM